MSPFTKTMLIAILFSAVLAAGIQYITKRRALKAEEAARKRQYKNKPKSKRKQQ